MFNERFESAQTFILSNARLLDRRVFDYLYTDGPRQAVIAALQPYQNPDGGFGNALEPDKRCRESQPVDAERALIILDLVGALDDPEVQETILKPVCNFLETITTPAGGVPFSLPSVKNAPHAPWWTAEDNPPADLNPTASLAGFLYKAGFQHPWLEKAAAFCWDAIAELDVDWYHTLIPVIRFLEHAPDRERAARELDRVAAIIRRPGVVEMDPTAGGYVKMPLDWAPTPDSFCRRLFDDDTIREHLKALAGRQSADGGWPISWDPISPGVDLEWRGWMTIEALLTLRAYAEAGITAGALHEKK